MTSLACRKSKHSLSRSMQYITGAIFDPAQVLARKFRNKYYPSSLRKEETKPEENRAPAKLRVICAGDEQTWQIRRLGRSNEKRQPLGLIKIFRTLALLITSTRNTLRSLSRFLLSNPKRRQQKKKMCVDNS